MTELREGLEASAYTSVGLLGRRPQGPGLGPEAPAQPGGALFVPQRGCGGSMLGDAPNWT